LNTRLLTDAKKTKEAAASTKKMAEADRVPYRSFSPLKAYVGKYENPGYGIVEIAMAATACRWTYTG